MCQIVQSFGDCTVHGLLAFDVCRIGDALARSGRECRGNISLRYAARVREFPRITIDPEVMGGKPCIRGMRVTVGMIVGALSAGRTIEDLLADFPYLEEPDIREALAFAASLAEWHEVRIAS